MRLADNRHGWCLQMRQHYNYIHHAGMNSRTSLSFIPHDVLLSLLFTSKNSMKLVGRADFMYCAVSRILSFVVLVSPHYTTTQRACVSVDVVEIGNIAPVCNRIPNNIKSIHFRQNSV